ncbi:MAG: FAD-dependent oxidoreductase [Actinomycetota bacterium]
MTSPQPRTGEPTRADAEVPRLLIVGGGFAGVWAALAAAESAATHGDVRIDLINPIDHFVPRPRLYESAPGETTVPLADILTPRDICHIRATATDIDVDAKAVTVIDDRGEEQQLPYDRVILATGSRLNRPPIDDAHLDDIDTLAAAQTLDERLGRLPAGATIAVIGAGFTGIELASELPARVPSANVVLLDRSDQLGSQLGPGPRPEIEAALEALNVDTRTGVTVTAYDGSHLDLSDGRSLAADIAVWTAGMSASPLTASISEDLDPLGRLAVDQCLRVRDASSVFAAGDTAAPLDESGHVVAQSAQHAIPQGACAGRNAVADLFGAELTELQTLPYGTCLDLGTAGAVFTEGWDRQVVLVGEEAKALKRDINTKWIYPPH